MTTPPIIVPGDLQPLIEREMTRGGFTSHDELLRQAPAYWAEHSDTLVALGRAIDDMQAGRMQPWEEFEQEFREKNDQCLSTDDTVL